MHLLHLAQTNRHRKSQCSSGGQYRDLKSSSLTLQVSLIDLSLFLVWHPKAWYPRSAEQKAAGPCTLKCRFQRLTLGPGVEMLVQFTRRGSGGTAACPGDTTNILLCILNKPSSRRRWSCYPICHGACRLLFVFILFKDIPKCPTDFWRNVLCTFYFIFFFPVQRQQQNE